MTATKDYLAALSATTDAAHVNETPKSEHDAGNVLTDAALIARLREIQGQAGLFASAAADLITALLARIAAMEAQIKGLEGGIEAACNREAETERKLRTALAASETRAEAAEARITDLEAAIDSQDASEAGLWRFWSHKASELATKNAQLMQAGAAAEAERDALRAERDALETERRRAVNEAETLRHYRKSHVDAEERLTAAEAQIAALTARVEGLTGALEFYADESAYETQYERLPCDCCTDIYEPINRDKGSVARAALSATTEGGK